MVNITYEGVVELFRESSQLDLGGHVSHQLVTIFPGATRSAFQSTFPTRYIYEQILGHLSTHKLEAAALLYDIFVQRPITRAPAGFILEDAVRREKLRLLIKAKKSCVQDFVYFVVI